MSDIDRGMILEAIGAVEGFGMDEAFQAKAMAFAGELAGWSGKIHLTGRVDKARNIARQFTDSIEMLVLAESVMRRGGSAAGAPEVADIGSGAGFPGLVWAMARPGWRVALFERKEKLAALLERTVSVIGLENAEVVPFDLRGPAYGESFDIAVSKAAGRLDAILPLAERILRPAGIYVTVKGRSWEKEPGDTGGRAEPTARRELEGGRGEVLAFEKGRFT